MSQEIPEIIIGRLPLYLRALKRLKMTGQGYTSSKELGEVLNLSPAQIRKDLSQFGELGTRGQGYQIKFLINKLHQILNLERTHDMAIVGAGDVGEALAKYKNFIHCGFQVTTIFDNDEEKIGTKMSGIVVQNSAEMTRVIIEKEIEIALLTTPAKSAQEVADQLVKAGIKAILNYAPIELKVPEGVHVEHIDPAVHLQKLSYYLG
ncbi:MAG: Redox-sensing transcriptional repressor Rex [Chloroflexi bacterium]|nr:Redox-sensing transcriptional repressor Rex [Chloroflexota bacterium]